VAEKTVAAAAAGDRLFIVPSVELSTALANAPSSMHVVGVTTLSQALSDLRAFGGSAWPLRALTSPH
jgi:PDZ domain-containing secreted protein